MRSKDRASSSSLASAASPPPPAATATLLAAGRAAAATGAAACNEVNKQHAQSKQVVERIKDESTTTHTADVCLDSA